MRNPGENFFLQWPRIGGGIPLGAPSNYWQFHIHFATLVADVGLWSAVAASRDEPAFFLGICGATAKSLPGRRGGCDPAGLLSAVARPVPLTILRFPMVGHCQIMEDVRSGRAARAGGDWPSLVLPTRVILSPVARAVSLKIGSLPIARPRQCVLVNYRCVVHFIRCFFPTL